MCPSSWNHRPSRRRSQGLGLPACRNRSVRQHTGTPTRPGRRFPGTRRANVERRQHSCIVERASDAVIGSSQTNPDQPSHFCVSICRNSAPPRTFAEQDHAPHPVPRPRSFNFALLEPWWLPVHALWSTDGATHPEFVLRVPAHVLTSASLHTRVLAQAAIPLRRSPHTASW